MATTMTDPSNALKSFQEALNYGVIEPQVAEVHNDILFLVDEANNQKRFTYALKIDDFIVALASLILVEPIDGYPCFNIGYSVDEAYRSQGYGKDVVQKAFDELANDFQRTKIPHLYIEAIVGASNEHSKKLANSVISKNPKSCTDSVSGESALQYVKQLF